MSAENQHSQENITAEEQLLYALQTEQRQTMETAGMIEPAIDSIKRQYAGHDEWDEDIYDHVARLPEADDGVSRATFVLSNPNPFESSLQVPTIRFATEHMNASGNLSTAYRYAHLAEIVEGEIVPADGFDEEQLELGWKAIQGLSDAIELGIVPHLDIRSGTIFNPNTAITLAPRPPEPDVH